MSAMYVVLLLLGYFVATVLLLSVFQDIVWRLRMKKREKELRMRGVHPHGATLSHGISVDKVTGAIRSCSRPNLEWYRRLLR